MKVIKSQLFYMVLIFCFAFGFTLMGAEIVVPEGDPLGYLFQLITKLQAGGITVTGIVAIAIPLVVNSLRKFVPASPVRKAIVVVLSVVYTIVQSIVNGLGVLESIILVIFTLGGAVMLYDFVIKPLLNKEKAVGRSSIAVVTKQKIFISVGTDITISVLREAIAGLDWYDWEKAIQVKNGSAIVYCSDRQGQGPGKKIQAKPGDLIGRTENGGFFVIGRIG